VAAEPFSRDVVALVGGPCVIKESCVAFSYFWMRERVRSLSQQSEFDRLYKRGKRLHGNCLTMRFLRNPEPPEEAQGIRWSVVVSRKIGMAVERNRVKRRVRALIRAHRDVVPPVCRFLLIAKKPFNECSYSSLEADVCQFLDKVSHV
jgi:ribonuclease P protein component